jgi:predicted NACHT family NTPase
MVALESGIVVKAAASAAANAVFKSAASRVERVAKGPAKGLGIKALALLQSYQTYLDDTNERVSTFKTFASPTQSVSLLDHFVTTEFERAKSKQKPINQDDLIERIIKPARIVVSATAGYGKSMVMRYIALSLYESPRGRIPIFLELRHLNRVTSPDILTFIHSTYRRVSDVQIEALRQGLSAGAFVILLDGFDELNHELRPIIENQILELTREFPSCSIVVSGRPDDRFSSWRTFTTYKIMPMGKSRVVELLNKLEYDSGTKKRFIAKINKGLYETHESFLSTPLLAILMLLTYEQNANIPDKIHLFYAKAFETLFHKHDAMKEQYDRSRKSGLQEDEFERVFAVFCLKTYVLEKTEFTRVELLKTLREAIKFEGLSIPVENYFFDVEEAVCLVMREGTSYFFVHRSFQEYFTAVFLANCPEETRDEFIDQVASRYWDNVLPMLFDMASAQLEPSWVLRKLDEYLTAVSLTDKSKMHPLVARFAGISFYGKDGASHLHSLMQGPFSRVIGILRRFYPQISSSKARIEFSKIEKYGQDNWKALVCDEEEVRTFAEPEEVYIKKNVLMSNIPDSTLSETNLISHCVEEYQEIQKIRALISSDQKSKNDFLNKLFSSKH